MCVGQHYLMYVGKFDLSFFLFPTLSSAVCRTTLPDVCWKIWLSFFLFHVLSSAVCRTKGVVPDWKWTGWIVLRRDTSVSPYSILVRRFVRQMSSDWPLIGMNRANWCRWAPIDGSSCLGIRVDMALIWWWIGSEEIDGIPRVVVSLQCLFPQVFTKCP